MREALGMTRQEFADAAGLSPNTIKSIEARGGPPGGEALEAICRAFPHFALWLMTARAQPRAGHLAAARPEDPPRMEIIASFDMRFPENCPIKTDFIGDTVTFVQCLTDTEFVCAIELQDGRYIWAESNDVQLNSKKSLGV